MTYDWWHGYHVAMAEQVHCGVKPAAVSSFRPEVTAQQRKRILRDLYAITAAYDLEVISCRDEYWMVRKEDERTREMVRNVPDPSQGAIAHWMRGELCGYADEAIDGYIKWCQEVFGGEEDERGRGSDCASNTYSGGAVRRGAERYTGRPSGGLDLQGGDEPQRVTRGGGR